ncbi:molybdopterin-dependent oxidoreductase [Caballeronia sp. SEWSISQ10-4 2]|uniref:molybdopterin-dependent oxidoreductase n=1 Tax=Caballeronia sp. SEWSISQ10-4 2 TaxID=2937438 RepID=UPI002656893D|nr:molybdopterin-dependent oxidoreductase [Caballeronia sp. SEWSISQ10-4 2]MDN7177293.1 molybdopterin-dependent oxidoreductase [Caballeronia sp. SEWSISQ10-4 2]
MDIEEKQGYCTLCRSRCGTLNAVQGDMLVKIRADNSHPTGSAMCMKGRAAPELVHSPNRILYPMRRTKPKDSPDPGWKRISWDEALAEVATRLGQLKREHGAESVAFSVTTPSGTPISDSIDWIERFIWSFGSPNICYGTEICNWHKDFAHVFTFGCGMPTADYQHSDVILLWGHNPANTWLAQADAIGKGRRSGAKLIVVDPRPTAFAKDANVWMRVKPGTDGALAMGIARQMIATGNVDEKFVREWTNAPLLVRHDTGRFLREHDLDAESPQNPQQNRYAVWNVSRACVEIVGAGRDTTASALALDGSYFVSVRDPEGRSAIVKCSPAFQLYKDALDEYTPKRVETLTGVRASDVVAVAKMLAPGQRIAYHAWSGIAQHTNATQTERSIATLYALTGAFDTHGSNRELTKLPVNAISSFTLLRPEQRAKALGLAERPIGPPSQGWVTTKDVYRAITKSHPYKVRALFAFGTNLLLSHADAGTANEALCALDFHVHCELFETPSSRFADVLLPVNTPWEREGLRAGFEINERAVELVQLRQRMVSPRGESRSDYEIVLDLAVRLGMGEQFFGGSIEAGWNHMLAPIGLDVATLREHPEGIYRPLEQREKNYATRTQDGVRGFNTETGRAELYSEKLQRHGYSPLPEYLPPQHGPRSEDEDAKKYPHVVTSVKNGYYCHSQGRSLASLRRRALYPTAEISRELAVEKGILDDDWMLVTTSNGSARFRARVVPELARDVIVAEYGWWQSCDEVGMTALPAHGDNNSNFSNLASNERLDPISGSSPLRSIPCNVRVDPSVDPARRYWPGFRDFVVSAVVEEAVGVRTITFAAANGGPLPNYLPGQHITVQVPACGTETTMRAYSLVGAAIVNDRRTYSISVRHQKGKTAEGNEFEGVMSGYIHRALAIGHEVSLGSPSGTFIVPPASRQPIVMFAGGIGITPFVAYLESIKHLDEVPETWLFYANRNSATHAFRQRILELQKSLPLLNVVNCYSDPLGEVLGRDYEVNGRITADAVSDDLIRRRARFYICGPEPMMVSITAGLVERGVPPFDIFKEIFRSPARPRVDSSQRFIVEFARSHQKAEWSPDKGSLLAFAEGLGIAMSSGCRVGQCESCMVRISAGQVEHISGHGPEEANMCFACQAIPASEITIEA